jgi:hypothetical protein
MPSVMATPVLPASMSHRRGRRRRRPGVGTRRAPVSAPCLPRWRRDAARSRARCGSPRR